MEVEHEEQGWLHWMWLSPKLGRDVVKGGPQSAGDPSSWGGNREKILMQASTRPI